MTRVLLAAAPDGVAHAASGALEKTVLAFSIGMALVTGIGFGWLGQAHSRSLLRIPTLFAQRSYDPVLVACSDPVPDRMEEALASFRPVPVSDAGLAGQVSDSP